MRPLAAFALVLLLDTLWPQHRASADSVYLPRIERPAPAEPCAPPAAAAWTVRCGGFGRIRDMYALTDGSVWAVGDGVALLAGRSWSVQLGADLFGLEALSLDEATERRGWAVGDADVIAELVDGRWRRYRPGEGSPGVDLAAISVHTESWAGGRDGDHAALRVLRVDPAEDPVWIDVADQAAQLPPIDDLFTAAPLGRPGAWAVGPTGPAAGAFMKNDGTWRVTQATVGQPRELAMSGLDNGWAFGAYPLEAGEALAFWRLSPQNGDTWLEEPELRLPGRTLLDAYKAPDTPGYGAYTVYLGAEPTASREPLILGHASDDDSWHTVAAGGAELGADPDGVGSSAIAPLPGGDVIYAWSDGVWRIGGADGEWSAVRRRRALGDLVVATDSAWLLDESTGEVLASGDARLAAFYMGAPGQLAAGQPGDAWLVGAAGATTRIRGPVGRTTDLAAIPEAELVSALHSGAGRVVAAGTAVDGSLGVWDWTERGWIRTATVGGEPMRATGIAVGESGWTWLSATGADNGPTGRRFCPSSFHGRVLALPPECATGTCAPIVWCFEPPMLDVTASEPDGAWAAGGHLLVRCRAGACRQEATSPAPFGTRFAALAAGGPNDVWAVLVEGARSRERSLLIHHDGASWSEACRFEVAITDMAVASKGDLSTLWLAGDWSTLIRHSYSAGTSHACYVP